MQQNFLYMCLEWSGCCFGAASVLPFSWDLLKVATGARLLKSLQLEPGVIKEESESTVLHDMILDSGMEHPRLFWQQ